MHFLVVAMWKWSNFFNWEMGWDCCILFGRGKFCSRGSAEVDDIGKIWSRERGGNGLRNWIN